MNLIDVRNFVRTYLDEDTEDLPDLVVDRWAAEAFNEIVRECKSWPFYETPITVTTAVGTQKYAVDLSSIEAVIGDNGPLPYLGHNEAVFRFRDQSTTAEPIGWSFHANQIWFWNAPDAVYTYVVNGQRNPMKPTAASAGSDFDLPSSDAEDMIQDYVLYKALLKDEAPDLADVYFQEFRRRLEQLKYSEQQIDVDPIIMSSHRYDTPNLPPARGRYYWEQ